MSLMDHQASGGGGRLVTCTMMEDDSVLCENTKYKVADDVLTYHDMYFWIFLGIYVFLVLFAGVMSGLTLGLLSLDTTSLQVLQEAGTPSQRKHAKRILPLVKRHHILLVTLLFANAIAVESMPIFLDRISSPVIAIVVSVTAVLLFGEVFPQALCSRFGLAIGATLSPLVYFLMAIFIFVSYPIAKLLDCMLGKDHGMFFRRAELKVLIDLHGPNHQGEILSEDEVQIIKGALELRDKCVHDAMLPLESVFMLSIEDTFTEATMKKVLKAAHSRIPVYSGRQTNVVGILLVKTLLMLEPSNPTPVRTLLSKPKYSRSAHYVADTLPLYDLLNDFQKGKSHLCVVRTGKEATSEAEPQHDDVEANGGALGIITLEDVLEELLGEEIVDETDVYVDVHRRIRVARALACVMRSMSRDPSAYGTSGGEYLSGDSLTRYQPPTSTLHHAASSDPLLPA